MDSRRPFCAALACIVFVAVSPFAVGGQGPRFGRSPFELGVGQTFDAEGRPALVVSTSVPYRLLVFLKREDRYEARYRIFVDIRRSGKETVRGDVWEESVAVPDYEGTKSGSAVSTSRRLFPIEAGAYDVSVTVEVIDTSLRYSRERKITILGAGEKGFMLSEPVFYSPVRVPAGASPTGRTADRPGAGEIVMTFCDGEQESGFASNSDAVYADFNSWPRALVNIVSPAEPIDGARYIVSARVREARGTVIRYGRTTSDRARGEYRQLCIDVDVDDLTIGDYELSVAADAPGNGQRIVSNGRFTVLLNRASLGEHFGETMEILSIFADEDDLEELKRSEPERRIDAWNRFWRTRDPNPSSGANESLGEYLGRLEHVLRSFSSFRPGWQTDRGRVYLRYGEPDDIAERQGRTFGANYELWYYYSKGLVYIFEDMMGTGDFRLIETRML